jgi:hypothetical protein
VTQRSNKESQKMQVHGFRLALGSSYAWTTRRLLKGIKEMMGNLERLQAGSVSPTMASSVSPDSCHIFFVRTPAAYGATREKSTSPPSASMSRIFSLIYGGWVLGW